MINRMAVHSKFAALRDIQPRKNTNELDNKSDKFKSFERKYFIIYYYSKLLMDSSNAKNLSKSLWNRRS